MATAVVNREAAPRRRRLRLPEGLPALKGKWLTFYSLCWTAVLLFALVGDVGGAAYRLKLGAGETYTWGPLGLYLADQGGIVRNVAREAQRAGIHPGESIVAANGVAVPRDNSSTSDQSNALENELQQIAEGETVRLTARAKGGALRDVTVVRRSVNAQMLYAGTGLTPQSVTWFCALCFLLVPLVLLAGAVTLFNRRRDPEAALLSATFLLMGSLAGEMLWSRLIGVAAYKVVSDVLTVLGFSALLVALLAFPTGKFGSRWVAAIALAAPIPVILGRLFPSSSVVEWLGNSIVLAVLIPMIVRYRHASPDERPQWRWALLGFVAGIGFWISWGIAYSAYLRSHHTLTADLWTWVLTPASAAIWVMLMVGGVTLSLLRYRLYDTSAAVSRSAAYGVLTLGFVALFAGAEKLAEIIGERYFEHSIGIVAGAVGAAVAAAVVVPLHNRVHRWAERRFQKPLIRLRDGLPELVSDLRESATVEQIVSAVMGRVEAGVRSTREALLLSESGKLGIAGTRNVAPSAVEEWQAGWQAAPDRILDCDRRDPAFPLRMRLCIETSGEPETVGWLLLGQRPDGSFFGRDEREALAHIAGPVARAIHIAQRRERREEQAEKRISGLEALVASLVSGLNPGAATA